MKSVAFRTLLLAGVSTGSLAFTAPTMAQDESEFQIEQITVTARRREESLQDAPVAVTAFSARDLELRGAADISELAQSAPSVTLEATRATNNTITAFIRGVGQQDPLAGFEPGVAIYMDDVYMARPQGAMLDIYEVERIEILRGPQGTLYGRNAVGGAVKYVTKRMGEEMEGSAKVNVGTYGQLDGIASISAPVSDTFKLGAAVAKLTRGGFGENLTTGTDNYDKDVLAGRVTAEFMPNEQLFVRISADYTKDKSNPKHGHRLNEGSAFTGFAPILDDVFDTRAGAEENVSTSGIDGNNELTAKGITGMIEYEASDTITLKSITAYREDYTESVIDFDSLEVDDFDAAVIYDNDQFTQEFQLLYNDDKISAVAGLYYIDAFAANDFDVVLGQLGRAVFGNTLTAYTGGQVNTESWSAFTDITYDFSDTFSMTVGGRYTSDKRDATVLRQSLLGAPSPYMGGDAFAIATTSDFTSERTFKDFTPRVMFNYKPSEGKNFYLGYSEGFKAGGFDPRGGNLVPGGESVEDGFGSETLTTWEFGYKSTFADGKGLANIALFWSDYKDMQIPGSVGVDTTGDGQNDTFVGQVTNAGKARVKGIEFESKMALSPNFTLTSVVSLLDPEIREWMVGSANIASERRIQNTPKVMAHVSGTYVADVANGTIAYTAGWSYKSKIIQYEAPFALIDQTGHSLIDASVVWTSDDDKYTVGLHGKNLADEEYIVAAYAFGPGAPSSLGFENNNLAFYGNPRTITLSAGVKF